MTRAKIVLPTIENWIDNDMITPAEFTQIIIELWSNIPNIIKVKPKLYQFNGYQENIDQNYFMIGWAKLEKLHIPIVLFIRVNNQEIEFNFQNLLDNKEVNLLYHFKYVAGAMRKSVKTLEKDLKTELIAECPSYKNYKDGGLKIAKTFTKKIPKKVKHNEIKATGYVFLNLDNCHKLLNKKQLQTIYEHSKHPAKIAKKQS